MNIVPDEDLWDMCYRPGCSEFSPCSSCKTESPVYPTVLCNRCLTNNSKGEVWFYQDEIAVFTCKACGKINKLDDDPF